VAGELPGQKIFVPNLTGVILHSVCINGIYHFF